MYDMAALLHMGKREAMATMHVMGWRPTGTMQHSRWGPPLREPLHLTPEAQAIVDANISRMRREYQARTESARVTRENAEAIAEIQAIFARVEQEE